MRGALRRWLGSGPRPKGAPAHATRWVVIDCESSGLDARRDRLLSIGAVAVREGRIVHADSFSAVLRQDAASDAANILVHGIGADRQLSGRDPADALAEFRRFAAEGVPVAFHADFDRVLLERAVQGWHEPWLDLAQLAPALYPRQRDVRTSLDSWLAGFAIGNMERHDALADAYATAQLLLVLLAEASRQGMKSVRDLFAATRGRRWLH